MQVTLVEHDERRYTLCFCCDERACQLAFGKFGLCTKKNQYLIKVGRKHFGADFVLSVKEVLSGLNPLNGAFVFTGLPKHLVADNALVVLPARVTDAAPTIWAFDHHMSTMCSHHQTGQR
jgi:hypothetical protein